MSGLAKVPENATLFVSGGATLLDSTVISNNCAMAHPTERVRQ
jgi:hypothetical protein